MSCNLFCCNIVISDCHFILVAVRVHIRNFEERHSNRPALFSIRKANTGTSFTYLSKLTLFPSIIIAFEANSWFIC